VEQARACWRQLLARVPRTPCARRGGHGPEMRASTACGRACGVSCAGQPDTRPRRVHAADQGGAGAGGQWPPLCVSRRPFGQVTRAHSVFWRIRGWRRARSLTQLRRSAGAPTPAAMFPLWDTPNHVLPLERRGVPPRAATAARRCGQGEGAPRVFADHDN